MLAEMSLPAMDISIRYSMCNMLSTLSVRCISLIRNFSRSTCFICAAHDRGAVIEREEKFLARLGVQ